MQRMTHAAMRLRGFLLISIHILHAEDDLCDYVMRGGEFNISIHILHAEDDLIFYATIYP